jgi:type IV pilus assembly protein PilM
VAGNKLERNSIKGYNKTMLELFTLKSKAFGLDISDLSLKIVQLESSRDGFRLASFAEMKLEKGIVMEGEIKEEDELIAAIKKVLQKAQGKKIQTKYVVASLPEQKAFLQIVEFPTMRKEDVLRAVRFQAENYIPYPIDSVYLDYAIIPPFHNHIDHVDILLASLPKDIVDSYVGVFEKSGLFPVALEIESLSLSRALIEKEVSPVPVLIVDLGAIITNVNVFSGHSLRLTTSISVSANRFSDAVAKSLHVQKGKAEELKKLHGLGDEENAIGKKVHEALLPAADQLVEQIEKYMEYHESHIPHQHLGQQQKKIKKIILCGGGANMRGLPSFLTKKLKTEVIVGNPWVNILSSRSREIPALSFQDSLRYTTALGLALRGIRGEE